MVHCHSFHCTPGVQDALLCACEGLLYPFAVYGSWICALIALRFLASGAGR